MDCFSLYYQFVLLRMLWSQYAKQSVFNYLIFLLTNTSQQLINRIAPALSSALAQLEPPPHPICFPAMLQKHGRIDLSVSLPTLEHVPILAVLLHFVVV